MLIAYDQELTTGDYTLDVGYRHTVKSFDVKIDSDGAATTKGFCGATGLPTA
ncbi:MAG TPA: hypothetical protein VEO54_29270 [Thermoanaerobaculia bacterium]|nr:hypothetical protein [Thermoanaerobaculia bacterium]